MSVTEAYDAGRATVAIEGCAEQLGMPVWQVREVLAHLNDADLMEGVEREPGQWAVSRICPVTRQLLNLWRSPEPALPASCIDAMLDTQFLPGGSAFDWPLPRR
ncbi:hypothetical protein AB0B31_10735 [Catellatospora citrea]|uniref:hypothetical protein n=1 Tax=Catellatospora citrea TaxID=53366 RepID=UPI0033F8D087